MGAAWYLEEEQGGRNGVSGGRIVREEAGAVMRVSSPQPVGPVEMFTSVLGGASAGAQAEEWHAVT